MDVRKAIEARKSVRRFRDGGEVTADQLRLLVEAGRLACSWKNDQPWRFVAVRSGEQKKALSDCVPEGNPGKKAVERAPVVIVLLAVPAEGEVHQDKPFWLVDCGIAGQQIYLQAVELGLGTVWVSLVDGPEVCRTLGAPDDWECVGLFPVGVPPEGSEEKKHTPRRPLEEVAFAEKVGRALEL
jgi:nitroreductase